MSIYNDIEKSKTLYVNCMAGIAGDMFLASLIDLSGGEEYLKGELAKLPLEGYELQISKDARGSISGLRFKVKTDEAPVHRHIGDIRKIICGSGLSEKVRNETMRAFTILAEAEAKVHGTSVEDVHFHEVGAVDSIIDLTGAMVMLEYLGWPRVLFSPLNIGSGVVRCAHGLLPVPAPAVVEILKGIQVYAAGEPMERVTPTGAALVRALGADINDSMPKGKIEHSGVGLGARDGALPNALRSVLIEIGENDSYNLERCVELRANIDDMTPQDLSAVMERLFTKGALDVWFETIQMKKNRPAVKLCCLGAVGAQESLAEIILRETTTLGVRCHFNDRYVLDRRMDVFDTPLGSIRVKSAISRGRIIKQAAEFDDILKLSQKHDMPILAVREILASMEFVPDMDERTKKDDSRSGDICCGHEVRRDQQDHQYGHDGHLRGHEHEHEHEHHD